jgi:HEAT repeat protein
MEAKSCSNCGKSKVNQMEDGRYWCAWCGDFTTAVDTKELQVQNLPDIAKMEEYLRTIAKRDWTTWSDNRAAQAMEQLGKEVIPVLLQFLKHMDPRLRYAAIMALCNLEIESAITIPALFEAFLKDKDRDVHNLALDYLTSRKNPIKIDATAHEVIPTLLNFIEKEGGSSEKRESNAWMGWEILARIGRHAVPTLVRLLETSEKDMQNEAARAIAKIGGAAEEAVMPLSKMLEDNDVCLRMIAAKVLECIGPRAKAAVPALVEALKDTTACWCSFLVSCEWLPSQRTEFCEFTETFHTKESPSFFQVNTQAARALKKITGKKFGQDM